MRVHAGVELVYRALLRGLAGVHGGVVAVESVGPLAEGGHADLDRAHAFVDTFHAPVQAFEAAVYLLETARHLGAELGKFAADGLHGVVLFDGEGVRRACDDFDGAGFRVGDDLAYLI